MPRPSLDPDGDVVTKKVKMPRSLAMRLDRIARKTKRSESEVLRRGIELLEEEAERQAAHERLVEWAERDAHLKTSRSWRVGGLK